MTSCSQTDVYGAWRWNITLWKTDLAAVATVVCVWTAWLIYEVCCNAIWKHPLQMRIHRHGAQRIAKNRAWIYATSVDVVHLSDHLEHMLLWQSSHMCPSIKWPFTLTHSSQQPPPRPSKWREDTEPALIHSPKAVVTPRSVAKVRSCSWNLRGPMYSRHSAETPYT